MRKGTAFALAAIVAGSLAGGIAMLRDRVPTAQASASPTVVTEHRKVTVYRTKTLPPATIVVSSPAAPTSAAAVPTKATPTPSDSTSDSLGLVAGDSGSLWWSDDGGWLDGGAHDD